jgi:hypothetical protein
MERKIVDPYWGNADHTQIICKFEYEDGRILDVSIVNTNGENPDWAAVLEAHPEETITERTEAMLAAREERQKEENDQVEEREERTLNEILFNHKIKLFEIEEIQNSKNRAMKSKIRKADSIEKASVYAAVLVQQEIALAEAAAETDTAE